MNLVVANVETDAPIPGEYWMVCFGAIIVGPSLQQTSCGRARPITHHYSGTTLQLSVRLTQGQHLGFDNPTTAMHKFG